IEDLMAAQESMKAQIQTLSKEIDRLRGQVNTPSGNYASQDDMKLLTDKVKEIDRKRLEDYDKIKAELKRIANAVSSGSSGSSGHKTPTSIGEDTPTPTSSKPTSDKGFEYVIKKDDTLSMIVQAYKEKNIKVTTDDILKANPGLKAEKLKVGQKIF